MNRVTGVTTGRDLSQSVVFPGDSRGAAEPVADDSGRLTPRLTPTGVVGFHTGEIAAYRYLEFVEVEEGEG